MASWQKRGPLYVKSHWLQFALSPGTCNIVFRFPLSSGKAWAAINTDISQWCVGFVCVSRCLSDFRWLMCKHSTTVGMVKGLSSVSRNLHLDSYCCQHNLCLCTDNSSVINVDICTTLDSVTSTP